MRYLQVVPRSLSNRTPSPGLSPVPEYEETDVKENDKEQNSPARLALSVRRSAEKPLPAPPLTPPATGRLPLPVIIPQRRPENKDRGFLYAYAPMLNECGIHEETFIDFLSQLNEACKVWTYFRHTAILLIPRV
jgi:hypothetical protein